MTDGDSPFFRGQNRMDWLFAVIMQTAVDWSSANVIQSAAALLGPSAISVFPDPSGLFPRSAAVEYDDLILIVAGSTKSDIQWVGDVLGSAAVNVPPAGGTVSAYFGAFARAIYGAVKPIVASAPSKRIALVGFSLGGAAVTILKDMLLRGMGRTSAVVSFGGARAGTTSFLDGYDASNYAGFGMINDPVPSVPPTIWTGIGAHNSWTPFPPFVTYGHPVEGNTLSLGGAISPGYPLQSVEDVILGFDTGVFARFHNQYLYATQLRTAELPDVIPDGFEGYPAGGSLDTVCNSVFFWNSSPWPWPKGIGPFNFARDDMSYVQSTLYLKNIAGPSLGPREIYFFNTSDPNAINQQWLGDWINRRALFLSKSCCIYAVKSALVGGGKSSWLKKLPVVVKGVQGVTEDIETSIAVFGYTALRDAKRMFHFRGLDSNWVTSDQLTVPAGNNGLAYISNTITGSASPTRGFLDVLQAAGLCIPAMNTTIPNGSQISAAAKATQGALITLTVPVSYNPAPGTLVEITGCKQSNLLNAKWLTTGPQIAGAIVLQGSQNFSAPAGLTGVIRTVQLIPAAISSFEFNAVSSKKTGQPSFLQRGRRSKQIRRR